MCSVLQARTNPFGSSSSKISPGVHHCQHQSAKHILCALKPLKPSGCKISSTYSGDKVLYHCRDLQNSQALEQMLVELDSICRPVKIKVHWIAIQANKAKDLLRIFRHDDCNLKNLWLSLLGDYINQGFAQTIASPEIQAVPGGDFQFQTQESFKKDMWVKGRRKMIKKAYSSKVHLSLKGVIRQLSEDEFSLALDLKHQANMSQEEESPQCQQALKTELLLKKGRVYCAGGIYQLRLYEKEQGNLVTSLLPWIDSTYKTVDKGQEYVSTVFVEVIDGS